MATDPTSPTPTAAQLSERLNKRLETPGQGEYDLLPGDGPLLREAAAFILAAETREQNPQKLLGYIKHWRERAEAAEAQATALREALTEAVQVASHYYMLFHGETWKARLDRWRTALSAPALDALADRPDALTALKSPPSHPFTGCKDGCGFDTHSGITVLKFCAKHQPELADAQAETPAAKDTPVCRFCHEGYPLIKGRRDLHFVDGSSIPCELALPEAAATPTPDEDEPCEMCGSELANCECPAPPASTEAAPGAGTSICYNSDWQSIARRWHMAFNSAIRAQTNEHVPACDGPSCSICAYAASLLTKNGRELPAPRPADPAAEPPLVAALRALSAQWRNFENGGTRWDDGYESALLCCADDLDRLLEGIGPR